MAGGSKPVHHPKDQPHKQANTPTGSTRYGRGYQANPLPQDQHHKQAKTPTGQHKGPGKKQAGSRQAIAGVSGAYLEHLLALTANAAAHTR